MNCPGKTIRRISPRQRERLKEYASAKRRWWIELVALFAGQPPTCAVSYCCRNASKDPHHKNGRLGSLLCETRLFIALCTKHHAWVHANITAARKLGLIAPAGQWNVNPFEKK